MMSPWPPNNEGHDRESGTTTRATEGDDAKL